MLPRLALSPHISAVYLLSSPPLSTLPPLAFSLPLTCSSYLLISQSLLIALIVLYYFVAQLLSFILFEPLMKCIPVIC